MNRLVIIGGIVVVVAMTMCWRKQRAVGPDQTETEVSDAIDAPAPAEEKVIDLAERVDQMSDPQKAGVPVAANLSDGIPSRVVMEMRECFDMGGADDGGGSLSVEGVLDNLQRDVGPPLKQGDLWTDWLIKMKDGSERKVHLENIEDLDGRLRQTVMVFMIDPRGQPFPVPLDPRDRDRPATEVANSIINTGEVQKKEKASYYQFARGERLEIIEVDGKAAEVEMLRDETLFRCDQLGQKPSCQCIK